MPEIIIRKFRLWVALVEEAASTMLGNIKVFMTSLSRGNVEGSDQCGLAVHIVRFTSSMKWMKLN